MTPEERGDAPMEPYCERPVQNDRGKWDALDSSGYGHTLGYDTAREVEIWLDGYDCGARENM